MLKKSLATRLAAAHPSSLKAIKAKKREKEESVCAFVIRGQARVPLVYSLYFVMFAVLSWEIMKNEESRAVRTAGEKRLV